MPSDAVRNTSLRAEAVLFDLDETLIDAEKGLRAAHAKVAEEILQICGDTVAPSDVLREIEKLDDEMNRSLQYNRNLWWQKLVDQLQCHTRLRTDMKERLTRSYWESYAESAKPYDDVEDTLRYLHSKNYLLGIITDTDGVAGIKRWRVRKLPFKEIIDAIIIAGEDTERTKPDPEAFHLAARELGVSESSCVFVGDKPFTDIRGARDAGMKTILVVRRQWDSEEVADFTIREIAEIKKLL